MQATELLRDEHHAVKLALRILDQLCSKLAAAPDVQSDTYADDMEKLIDFFTTFLDKCHHAKEEEVVFPPLMEIGVLLAANLVIRLKEEHEAGRTLVAEMAAALKLYRRGDRHQAAVLQAAAKSYAKLLTAHMAAEDHDLFPIVDAKFTDEDEAAMTIAFAKIETERLGPGKHEALHELLHSLKTLYLDLA